MSLVTVTRETRLILKISAVVLVVIFIIWMSVGGTKFILATFFPPPIPPPEQKFGPLPKLTFPTSEGSTSVSYQLNTVTGQFPAFPDRVNIYEATKPTPDILALKTARETVKLLGFVEPEVKLSDTVYQWTDSVTGLSIKYDILTKNFDVTSPYLTRETQSDIVSKEAVIDFVSDRLKNMKANMEDIDKTKTSVTFFVIENNALRRTEKISEAQVARVDYYQAALDNVPIYYPQPPGSTMNFFVSTTFSEVGRPELKIVEAHYNHTYLGTSKSSYPLRSITEAFADLQRGNAYIINNSTNPTIDITDIALGYYLNSDQAYLEPVFIFIGPKFIAYVPALPSSSVSQ